jgi:hypothetical protein
MPPLSIALSATPYPAHAGALAHLDAVWRANELAQSQQPTVGTGFAQLDAELPNAGWPTGALIVAKIVAPNWRVGYAAAPEHHTERLLDTKLLSSLTTPALLERALAHCIAEGHLRKHSERVRTRLATRCVCA